MQTSAVGWASAFPTISFDVIVGALFPKMNTPPPTTRSGSGLDRSRKKPAPPVIRKPSTRSAGPGPTLLTDDAMTAEHWVVPVLTVQSRVQQG